MGYRDLPAETLYQPITRNSGNLQARSQLSFAVLSSYGCSSHDEGTDALGNAIWADDQIETLGLHQRAGPRMGAAFTERAVGSDRLPQDCWRAEPVDWSQWQRLHASGKP